MAVAKPRHASFLTGRVVPLFSVRRAPPRNAFAKMAARAIPDMAGFPPGSLAVLFRVSIQSAPEPSALAAEPAASNPVTAGLLAARCPFLVPRIISNALAPSNDICTDLFCAASRNLAAPCHAKSFTLRAPCCFRYRGDSLCSSEPTVSVISLSVCRICSRSLSASECCSTTLVFSPIVQSP